MPRVEGIESRPVGREEKLVITGFPGLGAKEDFKDIIFPQGAVLAGDRLGPLHGVPFTVKDSIDTAGVLTQRGSPIFRGRVPDADATSVARMKKAADKKTT